MSTRQMERWSSWFKAPVLKIGIRVSVSWVRIPPSPPNKALCFNKSEVLLKNGDIPKPVEGDSLLNC